MDKDIRILINDNYTTMRRILKNLLVASGYYNVYEADDCAVAINILKKGEFQLLISEWNFVEGDCKELLEQIRKENELKDLKTMIMFSGKVSDEQKEIMKNADVSGYILKPFSRESLKTKLNEILGSK
jgi:two-component system chemotaxis response regulator CheY